MKKRVLSLLMMLGVVGGVAYAGEAEAAPVAATMADVEAVQTNLNIVWTLVGGVLVFFMQAGFAMVETGLTRAKNGANIMMKNVFDFAFGSIVFWLVGAALMFGKSKWGLIGTDGFMMNSVVGDGATWDWTFFFFQTMFAATAATIVSGGVAERTKFKAYIVYSIVLSMIIYPISGKWAWGSLFNDASAGWLETLSTGAFCDFAGSAVVHSVGGWIALAGAICLGPRIGKFGKDGKPRMIMGHNLILAALGVFILWVGWFGFNPASTTTGCGDIGRIALVTNIAAAAGAVTSMITIWIVSGKPDLSMSLNGVLAGLVAITAGCNTMTMTGGLVVGAVAGVLVVFGVMFFDKLKIDDPVGAVSVYGVNGLWGTLACGLFNAEGALGTAETSTGLLYGGGFDQMITQLIGAGAIFIWAFGCGMLLFTIIKKTIGLRVTEEEELKGLDATEHGTDAYAGFQIFANE